MIIPWNTDAPIYHFPFVTIGLIVANTVAFALAIVHEDPEQWMLVFGDGLHPAQWVTSVFMHADIAHLLGNMIFLWAFGLVIEGKIGWWRFLLVYLGMGAFESAVVQICMQHREGVALGASGAIYGLLAMSLIWAPRNEMSCITFIGFRPLTFDLSILAFVTMFVVWEGVKVWLSGFQLSSAMLHLAGALPGFAVAIAMLKLGLVDCENWDVFAVLAGREGEAKKKKPDPNRAKKQAQLQESRRAAALNQFDNHLAHGRAEAALQLHQTMSQAKVSWQLSQQRLLDLVKALHKQQRWTESVPIMAAYLRAAPDSAARMRLRLAQILIVYEKRPGQALGVLEKLAPGSLPPDLEKTRAQLAVRARKLYAEGPLEVENEDW